MSAFATATETDLKRLKEEEHREINCYIDYYLSKLPKDRVIDLKLDEKLDELIPVKRVSIYIAKWLGTILQSFFAEIRKSDAWNWIRTGMSTSNTDFLQWTDTGEEKGREYSIAIMINKKAKWLTAVANNSLMVKLQNWEGKA